MFYDNPKIEKIAEKVFIYKNFIDDETCKKIYNLLKPWQDSNPANDHLIDWYQGKITPTSIWGYQDDKEKELYNVWCKINELLMPEYCIHPQLMMLCTKPGDEMFIHSDSPGESMESDLTAEDKWNTCCVLHYGALVYFGEWEGGEVFYPHVRNDGVWVGNNIPLKEGNELKIKPNPGDLIIHGALDDYAHGVHEIKSGIRYAYSNFVLPVSKNPGTFPIYGTKENEERWQSGSVEWTTPINFEWKIPESLQKELSKNNATFLPAKSSYPKELINELKKS